MTFRWDDAKEDYLRTRLQEDPKTPISHFQEYFGISYNAVRFKMKRMGIQISSVRKGEVVIKQRPKKKRQIQKKSGRLTKNATSRKSHGTRHLAGTSPSFPMRLSGSRLFRTSI